MIEITRENIRIDKDFELNRWWKPVNIAFHVDCRFDVEKKFGIKMGKDMRIDMYTYYNPLKDYLYVECNIISKTRWIPTCFYEPSSVERETIISMLEECCKKETGMTCSKWLRKKLKKK